MSGQPLSTSTAGVEDYLGGVSKKSFIKPWDPDLYEEKMQTPQARSSKFPIQSQDTAVPVDFSVIFQSTTRLYEPHFTRLLFGLQTTWPELHARRFILPLPFELIESEVFQEMLRVAAKKYESRNKTADTEPEEQHWINATTHQQGFSLQVTHEILNVFAGARYESFEDGVETDFSRNIVRLVERHPSEAIRALQDLISRNKLDPRLVAEIFRWLGEMEHSISFTKRRALLENNLRHRSPYIRDGAIVGLAYMDDPLSIDALTEALQNEPIPELREYINETLEQLKCTQAEKK